MGARGSVLGGGGLCSLAQLNAVLDEAAHQLSLGRDRGQMKPQGGLSLQSHTQT
jgi:hypothetical protein